MTDPKVVLQAHALRTQASREALLHGEHRMRTRRSVTGALFASAVLTAVVVVVVVVTSRIISVLQHTGR